jgi:hypothetical protein
MIKSSSLVDASGVGDLTFLGAPYSSKTRAASKGFRSVSFLTVSTGPVSAGTECPTLASTRVVIASVASFIFFSSLSHAEA